jgi:hypothetical protein
MDEEKMDLILDGLSTGIKDNTVNVSALIELLIDKDLITMEEYMKYREREDAKMNEMIQKAINDIENHFKDAKNAILEGKSTDNELDELLRQFGGNLGPIGDA